MLVLITDNDNRERIYYRVISVTVLIVDALLHVCIYH